MGPKWAKGMNAGAVCVHVVDQGRGAAAGCRAFAVVANGAEFRRGRREILEISAAGVRCLCSPTEVHAPGWGRRSKEWPAHARREGHQSWVRAQQSVNQRRLSPEACQKQPDFSRSAAAKSEAAAGPAERAEQFMAAAAAAAAQQQAAAAEQAAEHEMHVLSSYSAASHAAVAAVSAHRLKWTRSGPPRGGASEVDR